MAVFRYRKEDGTEIRRDATKSAYAGDTAVGTICKSAATVKNE